MKFRKLTDEEVLTMVEIFEHGNYIIISYVPHQYILLYELGIIGIEMSLKAAKLRCEHHALTSTPSK